jgi:RIO-like serine/threonine protein kinase
MSKKTLKKRFYQKSGKIIAEGKDGWIYDHPNNQYVAKLLKKGVTIDEKVQRKLKEIDPNEERYSQYIFPESSLIDANPDFKDFQKELGVKGTFVFLKKLNPLGKLNKQQYRYLRQSLEILHTNNVSHGDLPGNVMLDPMTNNPIIMDWENALLEDNKDDIEIDQRAFLTFFKREI